MKNINERDDIFSNWLLEKNSMNIGYFRTLIEKYISDIKIYPKRIKLLVEHTDDFILSRTAEDEISLKGYINSCADFVINKYVQLKLILTETEPVIRSYYSDRWASLPDNKVLPVEISLNLIESFHKKFLLILKFINQYDLQRKYYDPEQNKTLFLKDFFEQYLRECNSHISRITRIKSFLLELHKKQKLDLAY